MRSSASFSLTGRRSEPIVRKTKGRNFVLAASVSLVDRLGFTFQASGGVAVRSPGKSLRFSFFFFLRLSYLEVETFRVRNDRRQQINCTRISPDRYRRKAGSRRFSHRHYSLQHADVTYYLLIFGQQSPRLPPPSVLPSMQSLLYNATKTLSLFPLIFRQYFNTLVASKHTFKLLYRQLRYLPSVVVLPRYSNSFTRSNPSSSSIV